MSLFRPEGVQRERRDVFGVHNAFENPSVPLTSIGLDNIFGVLPNDSGESVTQDTSLAVPTVFRCVALLSNVVAGCRLRAFKENPKREVFPALLSPSNGDMTYTQYELWELVVSHIALWGNAYVRKVRAGPDSSNGIAAPIVDLIPIYPERVKVKTDAQGNKVFEVIRLDKNGNMTRNRRPVILTTFEVMHIPGFGYDGVAGLSPIEREARTIGTAIAADKLAGRFYSKGTLLSGIINVKAPLANQTQADRIRSRWAQRSSGVAHGAEVAVLDAETSFQPLTIPPDSLQFLESRRWQTTEIARMFGIPPHLVGDVEKSTSWGTGIEQQNVGFVGYTVSSYTRRIEQRVSRELMPTSTTYSEFDVSHLLRGSQQERYLSYSQAIFSGWMTRNEVRGKEHMEPMDGLDEPVIQSAMETNETLMAGPQPGASPAAPNEPAPKEDG